MNETLERIEQFAHHWLARPAAWLVYAVCVGFGYLIAAAIRGWAWLKRWRHLPEGGVVAEVVREDEKR